VASSHFADRDRRIVGTTCVAEATNRVVLEIDVAIEVAAEIADESSSVPSPE
jgi:hypothetical protein